MPSNPKRKQKVYNKIAKLEGKSEMIIGQMTLEKASKLNFLQLTTAFAIITDKLQLLKGQPTELYSNMPRFVIEGDEQKPIITEASPAQIPSQIPEQIEQIPSQI